MGWELASRLLQVPVHGPDAMAVLIMPVGALAVVFVGTYALLARCLRDSQPAARPEILRALADVLRSLRGSGFMLEHRQPDATRDPDE